MKLRMFFTTLLSWAIALAPTNASSAPQYVFRYKPLAVQAAVDPGEDDTVYGVGNDIQAFFVAPSGIPFSKKIPVVTEDVVLWKKATGTDAAGISVDQTSGIIAGTPTADGISKSVYVGFDASGNKIARAAVSFTVFTPVGVEQAVDFYAHADQYFYGDLPSPSGVTVHRWVSIGDDPDGMKTGINSFSGTPSKSGLYTLAWRGFDYLGNEVAYAYGDFIVEEGPVVEELLPSGETSRLFSDQTIDKSAGELFRLKATVSRSIGPVTFKLIPVTVRPAGLTFSSSTGEVGGAFDIYDASASFRIQARDSYDGTVGYSNVFALRTLPATVDLDALEGAVFSGTVGTVFIQKINLPLPLPDAHWSISEGSLPDGLTLSGSTISGIPTKSGSFPGIKIRVTGEGITPVEGGPFAIKISPEDLVASTIPLNTRTNTPFSTAGIKLSSGGEQGFTVSSGALRGGLSFDASKGVVSAAAGVPTAGSYDVYLTVRNAAEDRSANIWQQITVFNPLAITYADIAVDRLKNSTLSPSVAEDSVIGTASYSISPAVPSWMSFNTKSGGLSILAEDASTEGIHGPFTVTIRDESGATAQSNPFTVTVNPRGPMTLGLSGSQPERYVNNIFRLVSPANAIGGASFSFKSLPSNWPQGESALRLTSDGWLIGTTTDPVGTVYSGLVIRGVDGEGFEAMTAPFDLTVEEPSALRPLQGKLDKTYVWTVNKPLTGTLPSIANAYGDVAYAFADSVDGLAMTDASKGEFIAEIATVGKTNANYTVSDDTGRSVSGTLTLDIRDVLSLTVGAVIELNRNSYAQVSVPTVTGGVSPHSYILEGGLPPGLDYANGKLQGTPTTEGDYPVTFRVVDRTGEVSVADSVIRVSPPLPFGIGYDSAAMIYGKTGKNEILKAPTVSNAVGKVTWTPASGTLPLGVRFETAGLYAGSFLGTPLQDGTFSDIRVAATDGEGRTAETVFDLVVTRTGEIRFDNTTLNVRAGAAFTKALAVSNAVAPLAFTSTNPDGMPFDLVLNSETGAISGALQNVGTYSGIGIAVTDAMGRSSSANITLLAVSDLAVASPVQLTFKRYSHSSEQIATANVVGLPTFELVSGTLPDGLTLDPSKGTISGAPNVTGVFGNLKIRITDSGDGSVVETSEFSIEVLERDQLVVSYPASVETKRLQDNINITPATSGAIGEVGYVLAGQLPTGVSFDAASGIISGSPVELLSPTTYQIVSTDTMGGTLGTSFSTIQIEVKERDALVLTAPASVDFRRFSEIDPVTITAANAVGPVSWEVDPALPDGLSLEGGVISGTPSAESQATSYTVTARDASGLPLGEAKASITISVGPREPISFTTSPSQDVLMGYPYALTMELENAVGDVSFAIKSGELPTGLSLDPQTGVISGEAVVFGEIKSVEIEATDALGGSGASTFVFTVVADDSPLELTAEGGTTRVGHPLVLTAPTATTLFGDYNWSVEGLNGTGLSFDPKTGLVSGTPTTAFSTNVQIAVSDATGRSASAIVPITSAPPLTVSLPTAVSTEYNRALAASLVPSIANNVGATVYSISGQLPSGVSFDPSTGQFQGVPKQIGTFGPVRITATDTLPGSATSSALTLTVVMNGDPIELSVTDFITKAGYPIRTAAPAYDNNLGDVSFFSNDLSSTGLSIDTATGIVSGAISTPGAYFVNVSIRDTGTNRVTSKPVKIEVLPDMIVTAPEQYTITALSDVAPFGPSRIYVVGDAVWNPDTGSAALPEGLSFDAATGTFIGNPTEIGTFGPFTVSSTDSLGDTGISNAFVIKVNPGTYFLGLANATLPDGMKRTASYSYDFKQVLTNIGMDESEIAWALEGTSPPGLSISNGVLSGTPTASGTFTFDVKASYDSISAKRTYTLSVALPEIALSLRTATLPDGLRRLTGADNSYSYDLKPLLQLQNIDVADVQITMEPFADGERFPAGLTLADGVISGTADDAEGVYSFRIRAGFRDGADEDISAVQSYSIMLVDQIGFAFNAASLPAMQKRAAVAFDLGNLIEPTSLEGITASNLTWSWKLDPDRDLAKTASTLPAGLTIDGSNLTGTPENSGEYAVVITASYDGRTASRQFLIPITLQPISLSLAAATIPNGETNTAFSYDLKAHLTATNIPASDVVMTANTTAVEAGENAGLPTGLSMDSATGVVSGTPVAIGTFKFEAIASWENLKPAVESAFAKQVYTIVINGVTYTFQQVSIGIEHACGVTLEGGLKCWGNGSFGKTGQTGGDVYVPTDVPGYTSGVQQVAVGQYFTCFVTTSGAARCFGANDDGQLGRGTTTQSTVPALVSGSSSGVQMIAAGGQHACLVTTGGALKCWGDGEFLQNGSSSGSDRLTPNTIVASGVASVDASFRNTCFVTTASGAKCFGNNSWGQLGNGSTSTSAVPVDVSGLTSGVASISTGYQHTCAVTAAGGAKCWGDGAYGKLGNNNRGTQRTPVDVSGLTGGVASISAGSSSTCAATTAGAALCWGNNNLGQVGNGSTAQEFLTPQSVTGLSTGVAAIEISASSAIALKTDAKAKSWGANTSGILGNGTTTMSRTPVSVGGGI